MPIPPDQLPLPDITVVHLEDAPHIGTMNVDTPSNVPPEIWDAGYWDDGTWQ